MADIVSSVTSVLRTAGYRTGNANPGGILPEITEPVLTVNLERANLVAHTVVVRVTVVSPLALGAQACESHGLSVCRLLTDVCGKCELQPSKFNPKTEMFSAAVLATFQGNVLDNNWMLGELCQVRFGTGYYLNRVLSVTSWQEPEQGKTLGESSWKIRVEEELDAIQTEEMPTGIIKITVIYQDGQEVYNECKLTSRKRVIRDGTLVQTWEATALNRTVNT
jgi:hypothetical protein